MAYLITVSTTDLDHDLSSNPESILDPHNIPLHRRADEACRLAEKCATAREEYGFKEAFEGLDAPGINLWYLTTRPLRDIVPGGPAGEAQGGGVDSEPDPEVEWKAAKIWSGTLFVIASFFFFIVFSVLSLSFSSLPFLLLPTLFISCLIFVPLIDVPSR